MTRPWTTTPVTKGFQHQDRVEATQRVLDEWMEQCDQMVMKEKMVQAAKAKLLTLEKRYNGVELPKDVKQEIARLKGMIAKLERDYEVKP